MTSADQPVGGKYDRAGEGLPIVRQTINKIENILFKGWV